MFAKVCSAALNGIDAYPVEVEVNSGPGETQIVVVGLPDAAVRESRDRVATALINSGFRFPLGRTTVNLAPADMRKEGPSFDLPIAIGVLTATEQMASELLAEFVLVGERRWRPSRTHRRMFIRRRWAVNGRSVVGPKRATAM